MTSSYLNGAAAEPLSRHRSVLDVAVFGASFDSAPGSALRDAGHRYGRTLPVPRDAARAAVRRLHRVAAVRAGRLLARRRRGRVTTQTGPVAADGAVLAAARRDGRLVRVRCLRVQVRCCGTGTRLLLLQAAGSTHSIRFRVPRLLPTGYWLSLESTRQPEKHTTRVHDALLCLLMLRSKSMQYA